MDECQLKERKLSLEVISFLPLLYLLLGQDPVGPKNTIMVTRSVIATHAHNKVQTSKS